MVDDAALKSFIALHKMGLCGDIEYGKELLALFSYGERITYFSR